MRLPSCGWSILASGKHRSHQAGFCNIRMEGAACAESCRRRLADRADLLFFCAHCRILAQAGHEREPPVFASRACAARLVVRPGDGGRQSGLAGSARHGRRGSPIWTSERGILRAWLDSSDDLCRRFSDARLLWCEIWAGPARRVRRDRFRSISDCASTKKHEAERLPFCGDGRVQRGNLTLCHGARLCCATRASISFQTRSICRRRELCCSPSHCRQLWC